MRYRNEGDVVREQQRRRRNEVPEVPYVGWDQKRQALIESGLVAERAKERNADV